MTFRDFCSREHDETESRIVRATHNILIVLRVFQDAQLPNSRQRYRNVVARSVRQQPRVHSRQPEELLDGHRRHTHTVRFRTDGHIRGRPREHEDPADDAQATATGRLRQPRPIGRSGFDESRRIL